MAKATKIIQERLKQVDMVFEVRDARIPFSSANPELDRLVGTSKARLVVLNKADLANSNMERRVVERLRDEGKDAVFTTSSGKGNVKSLMAWARSTGAKRGEFKTVGVVGMVVGMPNVGKSSIINLLRASAGGVALRGSKKQVARVGANPGVTRNHTLFCVAKKPLLYVVDTPGVMVPRVSSPSVGLRLALTRAVPDGVVDQGEIVNVMLQHLNRHGLQRKYAEELGLKSGGCTDPEELIYAVERQSGALGKTETEARLICCRYLLQAFQEGRFGRLTIDDIYTDEVIQSDRK
ncbi:unnamed protein product [Choristocarpus tenellus]